MKRALLAALLLAMLQPVPAWALLGMRISNLSDLNLPSWSLGMPALSATMDACIYTYDVLPVGGYTITATGDSGFNLASGTNTLPYSLYWSDAGAGNLGGGDGSQLSSGVPLTGRLNGNVLSSSCALTGPNARLTLRISQAALTAALAGTYTGTVTFLISAN